MGRERDGEVNIAERNRHPRPLTARPSVRTAPLTNARWISVSLNMPSARSAYAQCISRTPPSNASFMSSRLFFTFLQPDEIQSLRTASRPRSSMQIARRTMFRVIRDVVEKLRRLGIVRKGSARGSSGGARGGVVGAAPSPEAHAVEVALWFRAPSTTCMPRTTSSAARSGRHGS